MRMSSSPSLFQRASSHHPQLDGLTLQRLSALRLRCAGTAPRGSLILLQLLATGLVPIMVRSVLSCVLFLWFPYTGACVSTNRISSE